MKLIKKIVVVLIIVIAIPFVVALFTKRDYAVKREIVIERPVAAVFDYVKYLKNQDEFSKWRLMDTAMTKTYRGIDAQPQFVATWDSENENVGAGEQEIIAIEEGKRVDYELRFFRPFESTEKAYMTTESNGENSTIVTWGFDGGMDYPTNIMLLFMDFEGMIGSDLQTGLDKLKQILESPTEEEVPEIISEQTAND